MRKAANEARGIGGQTKISNDMRYYPIPPREPQLQENEQRRVDGHDVTPVSFSPRSNQK